MPDSIFSHTQKSFKETVYQRHGKGRIHAARLYSQWFRVGKLLPETWAEPQALPLVNKIIEETDFSFPQAFCEKVEGGTVKFFLNLDDGLASESVLIPMESGTTLCVSSQVGCAMGCAFCETGKMGLLRHLSCEEIVKQVFWARFGMQRDVRNIVFMGMGEPLDNYDAVLRAIDVLTDMGGMGMGKSRITLSTSGQVDRLYQLIDDLDPAVNLAVSINAPNDAVRNRLMPINRKWNMADLKKAMLKYCEHPRREIFIEYVLIQGITDSLAAAAELSEYLRGLRVKVNLIPYNPQKRDRFAPPDEAQREKFLHFMREKGYYTLLRSPKGQKIMAACGQLGDVEQRKIYLKLLF
ncbi:MAG TPA: 23S rRNA (adenine(2503)-C(2))-methyltransferase RlmN [Rhabdochlamydiaceae bacterium]|jgi:23S rRNA (adenine2503-C2)-methyltransferase